MSTVHQFPVQRNQLVLSEYWAAANPESPKAGVG